MTHDPQLPGPTKIFSRDELLGMIRETDKESAVSLLTQHCSLLERQLLDIRALIAKLSAQ